MCFIFASKKHIQSLTFITEQASPVLLTVALPGLTAGTVDTAGVWQALITQLALPAVIAPAHKDFFKFLYFFYTNLHEL